MTTAEEQLEVSRVFKAPIARVFEAWTDPELIVKWWGAGGVRCTAAEMDLVVGGAYRIANRTPDGTTMWIAGTFSIVDPPHRLAYSWAIESVDAEPDTSLVEVSFDETDDGTSVAIRHTRIPSPEARQMNEVGWIGCLEGLDQLLN